MIGAEVTFADRYCPTGRCFAFGGTTGCMAQAADVVQHGRELGVIVAERAHKRGVRLPVQLRRFVEYALVLEHDAELVPNPGSLDGVRR